MDINQMVGSYTFHDEAVFELKI
jgi:hypothetical protein